MQSVLKRLKNWTIAHFSKPTADDPVFQAIRQRHVRSILEIGVGAGQRAVQMLEIAAQAVEPSQLTYVGIDLFEMRPTAQPGLSLKAAHRTLKALGAKTRLIPGDPLSALSLKANELSGVELVVIGLDADAESMSKAWFYLPRTLATNAVAMRAVPAKEGEGYQYETLLRADIERLAMKAPRRRAA
jgi:hypothetical protein